MPTLTWAAKSLPAPLPASLHLDSVIFPQGKGYPPVEPACAEASPDALILGDNLQTMWALLPNWEGKIQLIYADPPFFTNRKFSARIGRGEDSRRPRDWQLAEGYGDHWPSLDAYLEFLYQRLVAMYLLLAPTGTLYLHLDWHANAYARLLLDEIFGADRLLNEVVWVYHGPSPIRSAFNRKHDTILVYTKSSQYTFNADAVRTPYDSQTVKTFASSPKAGFGKMPDLARGKVPEDWWYFPVVARLHNERSGYPTQKPEALLERIVLASSNPGDVVADFFCGSGTTPVVAARFGRHFIAGDSRHRALHTARARLVSAGGAPFSIWQCPPFSHAPQQPLPGALSFTSDQILLAPDFAEGLDYWEVDPAFDGQIFRSAAQALRPRRSGTLPTRLSVIRSSLPVGVRWVSIEGGVGEITL